MKSVLAGDLQKAFKKYNSPKDQWDENAVIAYINMLPKNLPIYLYWD